MMHGPLSVCMWAVLCTGLVVPQSAFADSTPLEEKVLVRFSIDSDPSSPNSISSENFRKWSEAQKIVKAFQDPIGGSEKKVLARNVIPKSLAKAIELNKSSVQAEAAKDLNRLWIAPFGTGTLRSSTSSSVQKQLPTYRAALPDEMFRVFSDQVQQRDLKVFVPDVNTSLNMAPRTRVIQMELTREELKSLHAADPNLRTETFNSKFKVVTESSKKIDALPINPDVERALARLFQGKKSPNKKPLLIILDDTWPTASAFLDTKNLIGSAFPELWRANSDLASIPPELEAETKKLVSPGPPNGGNCSTLEQCDSHAKRVDLSLSTMRKFAKTSLGDEPVDVLYVPMTASQQGAKDILRLLWNLAYAAGTTLAPNSPTFFSEEKTKNRQEQEFLSTLEEKLSGSEFISNWAILTSVIHFARKYSIVREVPVYISLSWTTEDTTFNSPVLTTWSTLIVAAAGNHCDNDACGKFADEVAPPRLFVERASSPVDVLLVVNTDEKGMPTCQSTRVQTSYSVVGFDGAISGDCGTSFAAPRVAWLMAARYAMTGDGSSWKTEQKDRLRWLMTQPERRKCHSENDFPCIQFPTAQFLAVSQSKPAISGTNQSIGGRKP